MSLSNINKNFTTPVYRDTVETAIFKNVITVVLCIFINYVNSTLVHTFTKHQVFNTNPRYILYIHLVINDILLLIMFTLIQLLSYIVFTLNVSLCMVLLIISIFVSLNNPLTLGFMAVECFIAICFPLRHTQICTVKKTYVMIGLIWALSALSIIPDVFVTLATESIEFFHSTVLCLRENVFKKPYLTEKRNVLNAVFIVIVWLTLFYTYFRILFTAKAAAADAKKARNTVLLHSFQLMLCMLNYVYNVTIEGLTYFFPKDILAIRFAVSIIISVLPRLISPLIYGVRDKTFRMYLLRYLFLFKCKN
ncbi:odorant receptor 131-2-like [Anabas testudineus]|uniref:odorant receptor 131-2-like n=1 Tax=Anabas testudineus TaxID=64144 RepID=UPI000E4578EE|nr:odorant receptor 131-2-like [Anabas testudineus]